MNATVVALLTSRKFWVGTISVGAVFASVLLVVLKIIPQEALIPTISSITAMGMTYITAVAWENVNKDP